MATDRERGRFVWYDLMTRDTDAAAEFYRRVVGWRTKDREGRTPRYTMWTVEKTPIGGVMSIDTSTRGDVPPHWMAYISTPDVDATVEQVTSLGGRLYSGPHDVPDVGRYAVLADPQGAAFSAFKPSGEMPGYPWPPQPGRFSWHELATSDNEAALDFYSELFGWEKTGEYDMGEMGVYQLYGDGDMTFGGMYNKTAEMKGPSFWLYYIQVNDIFRAVDVVKTQRGEVINGPMEVQGGHVVAQCMDPQGAPFALQVRQ